MLKDPGTLVLETMNKEMHVPAEFEKLVMIQLGNLLRKGPNHEVWNENELRLQHVGPDTQPLQVLSPWSQPKQKAPLLLYSCSTIKVNHNKTIWILLA